MSRLIALLQFLLALCGVEVGGTHFSDRVRSDGAETLVSTAYAQGGLARFECVRSASGACHYLLLRRDCPPVAPADGAPEGNRTCAPRALERFSVPAGSSRRMMGLPPFALCVAPDATPPDTGCTPAYRIAAR